MPADYSGLRVLIADDNAFDRSLVKNVLVELGFPSENIYQSGNGQDALDLLRSNKADFIICDWHMEPMDGVTLLRELRNPKQTPAPGIPVIFCSSQLNKMIVEEVREAGVNEVVAKPITVDAIQSRVCSIIERPRPVITLTDYVGPDRRRVDDGDKPSERRAHKPE